MSDDQDFDSLTEFLARVPGVRGAIGRGRFQDGNWWVKFTIDINHRLAWHVVQELRMRAELFVDKGATSHRLQARLPGPHT